MIKSVPFPLYTHFPKVRPVPFFVFAVEYETQDQHFSFNFQVFTSGSDNQNLLFEPYHFHVSKSIGKCD